MRLLIAACRFTKAVSIVGDARAQWSSDSTINTPICVLAGSQQDYPKICTDNSNGAIIVWQDTRNNNLRNIYAQRISASGHPLWTVNGVRLSTPKGTNADQRNPTIAS